MDLQLTGKIAIVTGGSRGIGKAIARELGREGASVAIAARDQATMDACVAELAAETGAKYFAVPVDTGDDSSVKAMVDAVVAHFGGVDILVNNAAKPGGQGPVPKLADVTNELFFDDMNVKVLGYLRCAREVAPHLKAQGWGRIINISGLAARQSGAVIGSMRNVAVAAMTKNLADELGPSGINVTVVHPGLTRTEKTPGVVAARAAAAGVAADEIERRMGEGNSVKTLIDATDIASIVTFLASPRSIAINGDAIAAGGGAPGAIHY